MSHAQTGKPVRSYSETDWKSLLIAALALIVSVLANAKTITDWIEGLFSHHDLYVGQYECLQTCDQQNPRHREIYISKEDVPHYKEAQPDNKPYTDIPGSWGQDEKLVVGHDDKAVTATITKFGLTWSDGSLWLKE